MRLAYVLFQSPGKMTSKKSRQVSTFIAFEQVQIRSLDHIFIQPFNISLGPPFFTLVLIKAFRLGEAVYLTVV